MMMMIYVCRLYIALPITSGDSPGTADLQAVHLGLPTEVPRGGKQSLQACYEGQSATLWPVQGSPCHFSANPKYAAKLGTEKPEDILSSCNNSHTSGWS